MYDGFNEAQTSCRIALHYLNEVDDLLASACREPLDIKQYKEMYKSLTAVLKSSKYVLNTLNLDFGFRPSDLVIYRNAVFTKVRSRSDLHVEHRVGDDTFAVHFCGNDLNVAVEDLDALISCLTEFKQELGLDEHIYSMQTVNEVCGSVGVER